MRRLLVAVVTAASLAGGAAATMALTSGTAVAQTPTQTPTPQESTPSTQKPLCHHRSGTTPAPTDGTDISTSFGSPPAAI